MTTGTTGIWGRLWARWRYVAEAMDVSPGEIQDERIDRLERAVVELQRKVGPTASLAED